MTDSGEELACAIVAILAGSTLTLPQLVDKLREDPRWRRVDARTVKLQLQRLVDGYQVLHERDGAAHRFRWFSPADAQVIGERNSRLRRERTSEVAVVIQEGLVLGLRDQRLMLLRMRDDTISPLLPEELESALAELSRTIAEWLDARTLAKPRR